jgi:hypothetical protein
MEKGTGQSRQKGGGKSDCFAKSNDPEMVDLRLAFARLPFLHWSPYAPDGKKDNVGSGRKTCFR